MNNGYQCYREGSYLFGIALFDEQDNTEDQISDMLMQELNLHRPKQYTEARIMIYISHIIAIYDSLSPKYTIVEMSNGFQHRIKGPYDYVQQALIT
jgi:RAB protein geranylgeranyltransferase component A